MRIALPLALIFAFLALVGCSDTINFQANPDAGNDPIVVIKSRGDVGPQLQSTNSIIVSMTYLDEEVFHERGPFPGVGSLEFLNTRLNADSPKVLTEFTGLSSLAFRECWTLNDDLLVKFTRSCQLKKLILSNCEYVTSKGVGRALKQQPGIEALEISNFGMLTEDYMTALCGVQQLKSVNLSGCDGFRSRHLDILQKCSALEQLDLSNTSGLDSSCVPSLGSLNGLRRLVLSNCRDISVDDIQRIQRALPACKVIF